MVPQYQKKLTIDINTTMVLYPGYMGKNVKKDEDVGLDDFYQSLLTYWLLDMKSSEIQLKVKEHFSDVFKPSKPETSLEASFKNTGVT